jgi:hypothetical protein
MGRTSIPYGTPNGRQALLCSCCGEPRNNLVANPKKAALVAVDRLRMETRPGVNAAHLQFKLWGSDATRPLAESLLRLPGFSPAMSVCVTRCVAAGLGAVVSVQFHQLFLKTKY